MGRPKSQFKGMRFGRLIATNESSYKSKTQTSLFWDCDCDCGNKVVVDSKSLKSGKTKSCGCLKRDQASIRLKKIQYDKYGSLNERFNKSYIVNNISGCWEWTKSRDNEGYALLYDKTKRIRAHRYSFELFNGTIKSNHVVCHTCDNPGCVNPAHLFQGTVHDNVSDMLSKERDKMIGSRNNKAKLNENLARIIYQDKSSSLKSLADQYNVDISTIKNIKAKKSWRHIHLDHINKNATIES